MADSSMVQVSNHHVAGGESRRATLDAAQRTQGASWDGLSAGAGVGGGVSEEKGRSSSQYGADRRKYAIIQQRHPWLVMPRTLTRELGSRKRAYEVERPAEDMGMKSSSSGPAFRSANQPAASVPWLALVVTAKLANGLW